MYSSRAFIWLVTPLGFAWQFKCLVSDKLVKKKRVKYKRLAATKASKVWFSYSLTQLYFGQWSSLPFCLSSLIVQWPARIFHLLLLCMIVKLAYLGPSLSYRVGHRYLSMYTYLSRAAVGLTGVEAIKLNLSMGSPTSLTTDITVLRSAMLNTFLPVWTSAPSVSSSVKRIIQWNAGLSKN